MRRAAIFEIACEFCEGRPREAQLHAECTLADSLLIKDDPLMSIADPEDRVSDLAEA
jgi:hypothetical protein